MAPPHQRSMTGDTFVDEKTPQSPVSPVSPTNTDATLAGDAFDEAEQDTRSTIRPSVRSSAGSVADVDVECAQPDSDKKRPRFLRRITAPFQSTPDPDDVIETNTRNLENTPNGFPRLAAFQSSEANFALYRSFSYLHSRVLLDLQDELTTLEKELDEVDWDDHDVDPERLRTREYDVENEMEESQERSGDRRSRRTILKDLREKLVEYDEILIKARTLESFQRPSDRNYRSVRRYHHNAKPLMDAEMESIRSKEDIVSLHNGREWATFDGGIETLVSQLDRGLKWAFNCKSMPLQKYFRTPELQAKTSDPHISFYSSSRIDKLVNILITFVIFCLLVIPVVTMYRLTSTIGHSETVLANGTDATTVPTIGAGGSGGGGGGMNQRDTFNAVGVLIVFTLLFSAAMSLLTRAARHELFAASAAYCAILVVFIGNFTGPGN